MRRFAGILIAILSVLGLSNCSARPIKSASLTPLDPGAGPAVIQKRTTAGDISQESIEELRLLNKKAGSPRFGLIKSFYQLPAAFPGGAVHIREEAGWWGAYRDIRLQNLSTKPYAIVPMSTRQGEVLEKTLRTLLDAGIRFAEVSMADAVKVIEAERRILEQKSGFFPGQLLPSGVELLITVEQGQGETGPVYLSRVIRTTDGDLLALASEPDYGVYALQSLIMKSVKDALRHAAK